jgi:hypothetical protein
VVLRSAGGADASIIDHDDTSVNFEFADDTFYIYFVRYLTNRTATWSACRGRSRTSGRRPVHRRRSGTQLSNASSGPAGAGAVPGERADAQARRRVSLQA